jgi:hypothetical protein
MRAITLMVCGFYWLCLTKKRCGKAGRVAQVVRGKNSCLKRGPEFKLWCCQNQTKPWELAFKETKRHIHLSYFPCGQEESGTRWALRTWSQVAEKNRQDHSSCAASIKPCHDISYHHTRVFPLSAWKDFRFAAVHWLLSLFTCSLCKESIYCCCSASVPLLYIDYICGDGRLIAYLSIHSHINQGATSILDERTVYHLDPKLWMRCSDWVWLSAVLLGRDWESVFRRKFIAEIG